MLKEGDNNCPKLHKRLEQIALNEKCIYVKAEVQISYNDHFSY